VLIVTEIPFVFLFPAFKGFERPRPGPFSLSGEKVSLLGRSGSRWRFEAFLLRGSRVRRMARRWSFWSRMGCGVFDPLASLLGRGCAVFFLVGRCSSVLAAP